MNQRDFIETAQGFFSVLSCEPIIGYLRYRKVCGNLEKVFGGVSLIDKKDIIKIYSARDRVFQILGSQCDVFEDKIFQILKFFSAGGVDLRNIGVTGSGLIKCYREDSDIDMVFYGEDFNTARDLVRNSILSGGIVRDLSVSQYRELYKKRIFSSELSFSEFVWHEKRKFNKGSINGTKFDVLFSADCSDVKIDLNFKKIKKIKISGRVIKAKSFSFPAYYEIKSSEGIEKILCFTHTYIGQAFEGDFIEVSGSLDLIKGEKYVVVGTTREAIGEYIKVI